MARKRADFKDNSMASRMNFGDSNDLNSNRIDPRTGEKFSFNVDISGHGVAAPATRHFHSCTFIHTYHPMEGVFVIVLYITSLKSVVT